MSEFNTEYQDQHTKIVLKRMFDFYEEGLLCNIDLVVGNNRYPVHKLILVTNSDFFKSRINDTIDEIIIDDSDEILADSVKNTIHFFYLGEIDLELNLAVNMIKFSKMIQACELEEYCLAYLRKNYLEIIQEDEFLNISCELLGDILQSDYLNISSEEQAFQGLKIWVQGNYEYRKMHLDTLLKYIRLPFLPIQYIINEVKPPCDDLPFCCKMLLDTFTYQHNPEKRLEITSINSTPRKCCKQTMLIVGGYSSDTSGNIEVYDADDDKWFIYHNLDSQTCQFAAVILNNKLIIMGGKVGNITTNKVSCFDLVTKETTELQVMKENRRLFTATVIDDQVFVLGGRNDYSETTNSVERYNFVTNTWTNVAHMLTARSCHEITVVGKEIYAIGGVDNGGNRLNTMEIYNMQQDKWTEAPSLSEKRYYFAAVAQGNHIYALGGHDGSSTLKSVELYDFRTETWTMSISLAEPRWGHKVIAFDDELIWIGGDQSITVLEYDPGTCRWTDLESISEPRFYFNLLAAPAHLFKNE
ncbi:kelch-like protein 5 [Arctopsyche grandis]|uniref:kelch-like protein 5 n=1 Tax=Arctopsyche grandis TaxID=121162 RepID=UPI00406D689D